MRLPSPEKYALESIKVKAFRGSTAETEYDITKIVAELNVFESLDSSYLTASMMVVDTAAMSSVINFNGTESIEVELYVEREYPVTLEFSVFAVSKTDKSGGNDNASVYVLELIETHAFVSYFDRIRYSLEGEIGSIVRTIMGSFGLEVGGEETFQSVKVIVPDMTPVDTAEWLVGRATSIYGEPVYLYSSIRDGLRLESLGQLMSAASPHEKPFLYTQLASGSTFKFEQHARRIMNLNMKSSDDIISLFRTGALRARLFAIDPYEKKIETSNFEISESFQQKKDAGRTLAEFLPVDEFFQLPDGKRLFEKETIFFSRVNATKAFENSNAFFEERTTGGLVQRLQRNSDTQLMESRSSSIVIPGYHMLSRPERTSVGTVIDIQVPKDQPAYSDQDPDRLIDKKRSGKFLVTSCRHKFGLEGSYHASLELQRVGSGDALNNTEQRPR